MFLRLELAVKICEEIAKTAARRTGDARWARLVKLVSVPSRQVKKRKPCRTNEINGEADE